MAEQGAEQNYAGLRRFFVELAAVQGDMIFFDGELAHHMGSVLRLRIGTQVTVCTGDGVIYVAELIHFDREQVQARIVDRLEGQRETAVEVVLYQGMPKGDKLELILQKCTELGVSAVVPVETSRSVARLDKAKAVKKSERWEKIVREASQQAKRVQTPAVGPYLTWNNFLAQVKEDDGLLLILWEDEITQGLAQVLRSQPAVPKKISMVVGPEGGLSAEEVEQLRQLGGVSASLGKRILRTETAGLAAVSMILYEYGDLG